MNKEWKRKMERQVNEYFKFLIFKNQQLTQNFMMAIRDDKFNEAAKDNIINGLKNIEDELQEILNNCYNNSNKEEIKMLLANVSDGLLKLKNIEVA